MQATAATVGDLVVDGVNFKDRVGIGGVRILNLKAGATYFIEPEIAVRDLSLSFWTVKIEWDGEILANANMSNLSNDGGSYFSWTTIPITHESAKIVPSPGSHTLRITVDSGGRVAESNEGNNVLTRTILVQPADPLPSPSLLAATSVTASSFTANWSAVAGATGYRLDVSPSSTFSSFLGGYKDLDVGNVMTRTVNGLDSDRAYYYRLRSYNTSGTSTNSSVMNIRTKALPEDLLVAEVNFKDRLGSGGVRYAKLEPGSTYYIEPTIALRNLANLRFWTVKVEWDGVLVHAFNMSNRSSIGYYASTTLPVTSEAAKIVATPGSHTIKVTVDSDGAVQEGDETNNVLTRTIVVLAPELPTPPTALAPTSVTSSGFTANWSAVAGAIGYRLDVSTSSAFSSFVSGYQDLDMGNATTRTVNGLTAGTTYYYRVRAYSSNGVSGSSVSITAQTELTPESRPDLSVITIALLDELEFDAREITTDFKSGATYYLEPIIAVRNFASKSSWYVEIEWDGAVVYTFAMSNQNGLSYNSSVNVSAIAESSRVVATPGTHTIRVTVDSGETIPESNETNNVLIRTIVVGSPAVGNDFDGDGHADLLLQRQDGLIGLWSMNGALRVGARLMSPSDPGDPDWRVVGSADFNNDGAPDILFWHPKSRLLGAWLMSTTKLASGVLLNSGRTLSDGWEPVGIGAVDDDEHPDLVLQHRQGWLAVWKLSGTGIVSSALLGTDLSKAPNWRVVGVGNDRGPGNADLYLQHTDGSLGVYHLSGTRLIDLGLLLPSTTGDPLWKVGRVQDLDGDGKVDLVFQHKNGDLATWYMDGAKRRGAAFIAYPTMDSGGNKWRIGQP